MGEINRKRKRDSIKVRKKSKIVGKRKEVTRERKRE